MKKHNKKLSRLLRHTVTVTLMLTVMFSTTYGLQGRKVTTNEFTGTRKHTPPTDEPSTPGDPYTPDKPTGKPDTPAGPDKPTGNPDTPASPDRPTGKPDAPQSPDISIIPENPVVPLHPPKTGDDMEARPWLIVLAICACILRHVLIKRKTRNY